MSKKRADFGCAGRRCADGDFDCDHEFAGDIVCEQCRFSGLNPKGLDPRYPLNHIRNYRPLQVLQ
jgi:hypothetical protein